MEGKISLALEKKIKAGVQRKPIFAEAHHMTLELVQCLMYMQFVRSDSILCWIPDGLKDLFFKKKFYLTPHFHSINV